MPDKDKLTMMPINFDEAKQMAYFRNLVENGDDTLGVTLPVELIPDETAIDELIRRLYWIIDKLGESTEPYTVEDQVVLTKHITDLNMILEETELDDFRRVQVEGAKEGLEKLLRDCETSLLTRKTND